MADYIVKGNFMDGVYADGVRNVHDDLIDLLEHHVDAGDVLKRFRQIADCITFSKLESALMTEWLFLEECTIQCDTKQHKVAFECLSYDACGVSATITEGYLQCSKRAVTLKWKNVDRDSGYIKEENTFYFYPSK